MYSFKIFHNIPKSMFQKVSLPTIKVKTKSSYSGFLPGFSQTVVY